jgi:Na+/H+-dicarboxylate symporter
MVVGLGLGWLVGPDSPLDVGASFQATVISVMTLVGDIFLRLLKMLVAPLVFVSMVAGIAAVGNPRQLGRAGLIMIVFFVVTTAVGVSIGLAAATVLGPGHAVPEETRNELAAAAGDDFSIESREPPTFSEQLLRMVPENPVASLAEGDMLAIIFFSVFFGIALGLLPLDKSQPVIEVLDGTTDALVRIVQMVMETAPLGVGAIMTTVTATSGFSFLLSLAAYGGVVMLGLAIHVCFLLLPALRFMAGLSIRKFWDVCKPAILLVFGTSSSTAALPVSTKCAESGLGVPKHIARLVIPVGATVNMDGTALYQGVATVFIAQLYGVDLSLGAMAVVVTMATLASVGAAGVPGAGMITLAMVLTSLGLPVEGLAIILGLDRILDMFRSAVNVTGDLSCAAVVARFTEGASVR